ncbi:MAG: outer membrane protein transport protein [Hyphomicrobiaceae bacterium]
MAIAAVLGAIGIAVATEPASAGGFAVREQSAEFQGMSFAGNGAGGGGLSGMFWNPAVAAYAPVGIYSESNYAGIIANSEITGDAFSGTTNLGLPRDSGDIAKDAAVPASYYSWRVNDRLVAAVSFNSPFGLVTEPSNRFWAGQTFARTSEIKTYNLNPTLAYRITPAIAIAAGLQIEHIEGRLKSASGITPTSPNTVIHGDDTAFGFTAGIDVKLAARSHIGLGYRSSIDHTLEGGIAVPGSALAPASVGASIKAGITLPEIVTLSLRHGITDRLTLLGTVEWSHWSRAEKLDVVCAHNAGGNPVFCPAGNGQLATSLPLGWHDGWFFSAGGEYAYSDRLTLRSGLAYEISPIQNPDERSLRVPDTDRLWASVGASYKWSDTVGLEFAYTHIFSVGDSTIDRFERGLRFIGEADTQVDIVSAALKVKLGGPNLADSLAPVDSLK